MTYLELRKLIVQPFKNKHTLHLRFLKRKYALKIDYMKMLPHIYFGTRFLVLDIVKLYLKNKNAGPHSYFVSFPFVTKSIEYYGLNHHP